MNHPRHAPHTFPVQSSLTISAAYHTRQRFIVCFLRTQDSAHLLSNSVYRRHQVPTQPQRKHSCVDDPHVPFPLDLEPRVDDIAEGVGHQRGGTEQVEDGREVRFDEPTGGKSYLLRYGRVGRKEGGTYPRISSMRASGPVCVSRRTQRATWSIASRSVRDRAA